MREFLSFSWWKAFFFPIEGLFLCIRLFPFPAARLFPPSRPGTSPPFFFFFFERGDDDQQIFCFLSSGREPFSKEAENFLLNLCSPLLVFFPSQKGGPPLYFGDASPVFHDGKRPLLKLNLRATYPSRTADSDVSPLFQKGQQFPSLERLPQPTPKHRSPLLPAAFLSSDGCLPFSSRSAVAASAPSFFFLSRQDDPHCPFLLLS